MSESAGQNNYLKSISLGDAFINFLKINWKHLVLQALMPLFTECLKGEVHCQVHRSFFILMKLKWRCDALKNIEK